jgi:hypothetical protein
LDGLHVRNCHFISRGHACILAPPAANKKAWLSGVRIARESYLAREACECDNMRTLMLHWLAGD